jgi:hypothetical protein
MDNLMSMFNPESMKNLMENEEIKKMMSDPNLMGNLKNMMGGMPGMPNETNETNESTGECDEGSNCCNVDESYGCESNECNLPCDDGECGDIKIDDLENIEIDGNRLNVGDKILTQNLTTESYNNRKGVIEEILPNGRCVILFDDDDKVVAIKEEKLVNRYENIENID